MCETELVQGLVSGHGGRAVVPGLERLRHLCGCDVRRLGSRLQCLRWRLEGLSD